MATQAEIEDYALGKYICDHTPYTRMEMWKIPGIPVPAVPAAMPVPPPQQWYAEVEAEYEELYWSFKGTNHRVARALRIPVKIIVEIRDQANNLIRTEEYLDHLLIGYQGGGGGI